FTFNATAGTQEVRVEFDNDYCSTTEDRNLYVENLKTSCSSGAVTTAPGGTGTGSGSGTGTGTNPPPPPSNGAIRIMPLGDSITLGVNGGYRDGLWDRLTNAGRTIDYVGSQSDEYTLVPDHDHEGHPGFTIGNIASSVDGWIATYQPTHVLLMIGTNDVAWWCAQSASDVADANGALIDQILNDEPGVWVIVGSIPPLTSQIIAPNNVDRAQLAADYDVQLQARVQARIDAGKRVKWADVHAVLSTSDLYDGVHPTQAASDKVAQVWYDALTPTLP
ncbi:MAG: GDSL-type esterase/lipase family protein, partial [Polyangiaceae bacterium]